MICKGHKARYKLFMKHCTQNKSKRPKGTSTVPFPTLHHAYKHMLISVQEKRGKKKNMYLTVVEHALVSKPRSQICSISYFGSELNISGQAFFISHQSTMQNV